jgi:hypothetical protein
MKSENSAHRYFLIVTETGSKAARFHYQVVDEEGTVYSERRSNREYVACTITGEFYFGRLDLIGKGDHGRRVKWCAAKGIECPPVAFINPK